MKINKVMIAGVDNDTNIKELEKLTADFPFVEWGVLFSKHKEGQKRYPDKKWISEFISASIGYPSAHFCGAYPREILEKGDFTEIGNLNIKFDSVQFNYNFSRSSGWKMENVLYVVDGFLDIILQYNKSNASFLNREDLKEDNRIRFLYDASGGRGTEITKIEKPTWNNYTGYAGGINKDNIVNIARQLQDIEADNTCWIDLESGARDKNNNFSFKKTYKILDKVEPYITL